MAGAPHLSPASAVTAALVAATALLLLAAGTAAAGNTTDGSNLALLELDLEPGKPAPGDDVVFSAEVLNDGNETLENVTVEFTLDNDTFERVTLPSLEPDNRTWVDAGPWEAEDGEHRIEAEVDPDDVHDETAETDNALSQTFEVTSLPNLVAEDLDVRDFPLYGDENASFTARVANEAAGDAGNFTVELWVEDHGVVARERVPGLAANSTTYVDLEVGGSLDVGYWTALVHVDADDEVNETTKYDNDLYKPITVLPPEPADLAVPTLEVERERIRTADAQGPANPVAGQEITYEVANQGDGRTIYYAYAYVSVCPEDADVPAPRTDSRCDQVDARYVPTLEPGESVTETTEWDTFGKAGDWTVTVDVYYQFEEASTDNNERTRDTFVAVGGTGAGGVDATDTLRTTPTPPVDRIDDHVEYLLWRVADEAADIVEEGPGPVPTTHEAGHYGVDYAEANYWNAQHMLQSEEEREREGPSYAWLDETQRGLDMALRPAREEARYPGAVPFLGGERAVNGSQSAYLREAVVWEIVYGFADVLGVPEVTDEAVRVFLEEPIFVNLQQKSVNDRMREDVFPAGHQAVDALPQLP